MADEIVSLSVLLPLWDGLYQLYHTERKADGSEERGFILCAQEGVEIGARPYPVWRFRREGERLHVHPSVHNTLTGFHNAGQWSVAFVEVSPEVEDIDGSKLHRDLNLRPEKNGVDATWQVRLVAEKRAAGILL
jgi:hypothetical protein